jgi:hypothetical protein
VPQIGADLIEPPLLFKPLLGHQFDFEEESGGGWGWNG